VRAAVSTRREFLASGLFALPPFSWFRPRRMRLCGVEFDLLRRGRPDTRYLVIHGDETTARDALRAHMRRHSGLAFLVRNGERMVTIAGARIDPNRLFSREGAERSLRRANPGWDETRIIRVLDWLDSQRERSLHRLLPPAGHLLLALHNNSRGYSVQTEIPLSEETSLPRLTSDPHNFYLCTDPADFARLRDSGYNAVLQRGALGTEDGSLSRLCARRGVRYVNLEVQLGDTKTQREMLEFAVRRLTGYPTQG
jgi:hypothetical protein